MLATLLDLSNAARSAAAVGHSAAVSEAVMEMERRMRALPSRRLDDELMHGRKAIDASFNLALAGVESPWMFELLVEHAEREVLRWGRRKSCSSMTLCQLAERLAAAGFRGQAGVHLFSVLGDILLERGDGTYDATAQALVSGDFGLANSLPAARWVNRASAKQAKVASASATDYAASADWGGGAGNQARDALSAPRWEGLFADPTRPLTLDLGSGYGCGPLIYSQSSAWQGDNVLGCDLSCGGTSFARGLASRWDVSGSCAFVRDDARAVLRQLRTSYPGAVHRIILSCPTPYAATGDDDGAADLKGDVQEGHREEGGVDSRWGSGNSQLPATADDTSFLGHDEIIDEIAACLAPGGQLYLASNVEDCAVTMARKAQSKGLRPQEEPRAADRALELLPTRRESNQQAAALAGGSPSAAAAQLLVPRRQARWRELGGERAEGAAWDAAGPMLWASETERMHLLEARPLHRIVLRKEDV